MSAQSSRDFDSAKLPAELRALGQPISVHRPWVEALNDAKNRALTRFFSIWTQQVGERWINSNGQEVWERLGFFGAASFMVLAGLGFVWAYYYRPPADPRHLPVFAGGAFVFAIGLGLRGLFHQRSNVEDEDVSVAPPRQTVPSQETKDRPDLYVVYAEGLAIVTGQSFQFLRWNKITEVGWVWSGLDRYVVVSNSNGQHIAIYPGFTDMGNLRHEIFQRVNEVMLPKILRRLAEGKSARFGPFVLRQSGLKYKVREADWDDIASIKIENYKGDIRLVIRTSGRLLHWCWCPTYNIPNFDTFYDAICRTAPEHLLEKATPPRW